MQIEFPQSGLLSANWKKRTNKFKKVKKTRNRDSAFLKRFLPVDGDRFIDKQSENKFSDTSAKYAEESVGL